MKIAHYAPFAPSRSGLYEAARDMLVADSRAGHRVGLVDVGVMVGEQWTPPDPDAVDARAGYTLRPVPPEWAKDADLLIAHTDIPAEWLELSDAPIVWIIHGRPLACFRPELAGQCTRPYSLIAERAARDRVRKMVTFWPEHVPYWRVLVPPEKLVCLKAPPIDELRFSPHGQKHEFPADTGGAVNLLISESRREDVDTFEVAHGALEAARQVQGLKVHFYGVEYQLVDGQARPLSPWDRIFQAFAELGALGEVCGRVPNIADVYRAVDFVLSPQTIATRSVAEPLSCGTPVIADAGNCWTPLAALACDPEQFADTIVWALNEKRHRPEAMRASVRRHAEQFSLSNYSKAMAEVYGRAGLGSDLFSSTSKLSA